MTTMLNDVEKVLIPAEEIKACCKRLGEQISKDYDGKNPIVIGLLKGCEPFMSDLIQNITCYIRTDYMDVSSYFGTNSTGNVIIKKDLDEDVAGQDVIIVDDIIDSGATLCDIINLLKGRGAKSVVSCVLLTKNTKRKYDVNVQYVGTEVPNEFVVGYGLDYNEAYRNLPFIGVLKEEIYKK